MAIPNQKEIGWPILEFLKDGKEHHIDKIAKRLEDHFELSKEDRSLQKSSGREGLFHNRIRWANFYLRKAGLVDSARGTGMSKITADGKDLLKEEPAVLDMKYLMRFPAFAEYRENVRKK